MKKRIVGIISAIWALLAARCGKEELELALLIVCMRKFYKEGRVSCESMPSHYHQRKKGYFCHSQKFQGEM
jgi:hypothetical protein